VRCRYASTFVEQATGRRDQRDRKRSMRRKLKACKRSANKSNWQTGMETGTWPRFNKNAFSDRGLTDTPFLNGLEIVHKI
jgi:hypothetical protein